MVCHVGVLQFVENPPNHKAEEGAEVGANTLDSKTHGSMVSESIC